MTSNISLGESILYFNGKFGLRRCSDFYWENPNYIYKFVVQQFKIYLNLKVNYKQSLVQLGIIEVSKNEKSNM